MAIDLLTRDDLDRLGRFLVIMLSAELERQKHIATGQLDKSLEHKVVRNADGWSLEIYAEEHALYVNRGRRPGGRKVPIGALMDWIVTKGLASGDKEIKSMAFAIQTNIFKYGIPTRRGRQIAARRTQFIDLTLDRFTEKIFTDIEEAVFKHAQHEIDTTIERANREIKAA